jgi:F420-dependent oxidoreductase-like protein
VTVQLCIMIEPQQGASYGQQLAVAEATRAGGFLGLFRSDHYLSMGGTGLPGPTDAWVSLGGLARETEGIRLGTMVTSATFRHPSVLAISVAQVDAMSGGRVELGMGTGWFEAEHTAWGIGFPSLAERFERLEEQLEIVTGLWATPDGERFWYAGRHWSLQGSPALPKPVQRPRPPVIVGGSGPRRTPRLAARFADEYNLPFKPLEATGAQFDRVRAACDAAGRDPASLRLSAAQTVACGSDQAEAARRAAAIGRDPRSLRHEGLAGTPEEVAERLLAFAELGAERVYLQVLDLGDLEHVALLGAEVLPRVSADSGPGRR